MIKKENSLLQSISNIVIPIMTKLKNNKTVVSITEGIWLGWIWWKLLISGNFAEQPYRFSCVNSSHVPYICRANLVPLLLDECQSTPWRSSLTKSGNRHNHASWFLAICWTSCIVILHLLVARFEIARSICCRANNRWCFRKYRVKNYVLVGFFVSRYTRSAMSIAWEH